MNIKKSDQDIKLILPNLGQDGQILVEFFMPIIREIEEENERFRQENKAMRDQLSRHSHNSSKTPSQEVNRPVKRGSEKGGAKRMAGGHKGHKNQGGKLKDSPDAIVPYTLGTYRDCDHDRRQVEVEGIVRRRVEDILPGSTVGGLVSVIP